MEQDLLSQPVLRKVLTFCMPLALGMASHAAFNLVDLWIVGELGEHAIAAVHNASTINFLPMVLGNGISIGAMAVIAQLMGSNGRNEARLVSNFSCLLMLVSGLVLGVAFYLVAGPCIAFLNTSEGATPDAIGYLEVSSIGTFTMFLMMHITGVLRAIGNAFWPVVLLIGSNALNIVLDFVLIFGWDAVGIGAHGAEGAAWASVIARGVGSVAGLALLARDGDNPLRLGFALPRQPIALMKRISRLGMFQSTQMFVRAAIVVVLTALAGSLGGEPAQVALSVGTRLDTFVLFAGIGWATGCTSMVGQALGRGLEDRCRSVAYTTAIASAIVSAVVGIWFAVSSDWLMTQFGAKSAQAFEYGKTYLLAMAGVYPAATASLVLAGAMNGVGNAARPMLFDLVVLGVGLQPILWGWYASGAGGGLRVVMSFILVAYWALLGLYLLAFRGRGWLRGSGMPAQLPESTTS